MLGSIKYKTLPSKEEQARIEAILSKVKDAEIAHARKRQFNLIDKVWVEQ